MPAKIHKKGVTFSAGKEYLYIDPYFLSSRFHEMPRKSFPGFSIVKMLCKLSLQL